MSETIRQCKELISKVEKGLAQVDEVYKEINVLNDAIFKDKKAIAPAKAKLRGYLALVNKDWNDVESIVRMESMKRRSQLGDELPKLVL